MKVTWIALVFLACFGVVEHLIRAGALLVGRGVSEYSLFYISDYVLYWLRIIPYPDSLQGAVPQFAPRLTEVTFVALLLLIVLAVLIVLVNVLHIIVRSVSDPGAECTSSRLQYQWAGLYILAFSAAITWMGSSYWAIPPAFLLALDSLGGYMYFRAGAKSDKSVANQQEREK